MKKLEKDLELQEQLPFVDQLNSLNTFVNHSFSKMSELFQQCLWFTPGPICSSFSSTTIFYTSYFEQKTFTKVQTIIISNCSHMTIVSFSKGI